MKLIKLRIKNLNSLYGEWEIDFTAPEYSQEGIFLVAGRTGAGKTTILDAICLALYAQTPRVKEISTENIVMSRGTAESIAELTFELEGKAYRAQWMQQRARGKENGKLQRITHNLIDHSTGKIIAESKNKGTMNAIKSLLDMDFTRFCHSVMLPQGQFAAFLKANPNDRSEMLQAITGTEIYSQISKWIYAHYSKINSDLKILNEKLEVINILSPQEEKELQEKNQQLAGDLDALKEKIVLLTQRAQLLKTQREIENDLVKLQKDREQHEQDSLNFEPTLLRLARFQQASLLEPVFTKMNDLRDKKSATIQKLNELKSTLETTEKELLPAMESFKEACSKLLALQTNLSENEKIWKAVRELDIIHDETKKQFDKINEELANLDKSQKKNQNDLTDKEREYNEKSRSTIQMQQIHACLQKECEPDAIVAYLESLFHVNKLALELENMENRRDFTMNHIENLIIKRDNLSKNLSDLKEYKILAQKIEDLRSNSKILIQGEPCPLCGALEHPYACENNSEPFDDNQMDNQIEQVQNELNSVISDLDKTQRNSGQIDNSIKQQQEDLKHAKELLTQLQQQLEVRAPDTVSISDDEKFLALKDSFTQITSELSLIDAELSQKKEQEHNEICDLLSRHEVGITPLLSIRENTRIQTYNKALELESHLAPLQSELEVLKTQLSSTNSRIVTLTEERNSLEKTMNEKRTKRRTIFGDKDCVQDEERYKSSIQQAKSIKDKAQSTRDNLKGEQDRLSGENSAYQETLAQLTQQFDIAATDYGTALSNSGFTDDADFQSARLSTDERERMERQQQELIKTDHLIKTRQDELASQLENLNKQISEGPDEKATQTEIVQTQALRDEMNHQKGIIDSKLNDNSSQREKFHDLTTEKQSLETNEKQWKILNDLIGSADGKKYRNIVQEITFKLVLEHANIQLTHMTDRYLLCPDKKDALLPAVIDRYQANEERPVGNLSGGESFLVSLALAFGFSEMINQKTPLNSLFLDEGFGSLDESLLDSAIETIKLCNKNNKLIGIISHVAAIQERIGTRINVVTQSAGRSRVEGPGCRKIQ